MRRGVPDYRYFKLRAQTAIRISFATRAQMAMWIRQAAALPGWVP